MGDRCVKQECEDLGLFLEKKIKCTSLVIGNITRRRFIEYLNVHKFSDTLNLAILHYSAYEIE